MMEKAIAPGIEDPFDSNTELEQNLFSTNKKELLRLVFVVSNLLLCIQIMFL